MEDNQKRENLLNFALDLTKEDRGKSPVLNIAFDTAEGEVEVIVKYNGDLVSKVSAQTKVELLLADFAIVTLPISEIDAFSALQEVEYMEVPKRLYYNLYESKQASCIFPVTRGEKRLTGKGVLVAILDSGIDYYLEDFQYSDGKTRILSLWDQSLGVEFTEEQINQAIAKPTREEAFALVPSVDDTGHGTVVAAIAASSNSNMRLQGVAPESDLLIVKLGKDKEPGFPKTTQLMRGITYVVEMARKLNRPMVINLSFGNTYGPHTGTSLLEMFLEAACQMGKTVLCIGAGNEADSGGHAEGTVGNGKEIELVVAGPEKNLMVQLWKNYGDQIFITLEAPTGERFFIDQRNLPRTFRLETKDTLLFIYVGVPTPFTLWQEIFFDFVPKGEVLESGIWKFYLQSYESKQATYSFYLPSSQVRNPGTRFLASSPNQTITIPGTMTGAITVGAYDDFYGAYSAFSGRGEVENEKTFGNRQKPDLVAPGVDIAASKRGGGIGYFTGTSFACPMVSGSAALLMEWGIVQGKDPFLYGEKIKAYLQKGARKMGRYEKYPNNQVGFGALCLENSFPDMG